MKSFLESRLSFNMIVSDRTIPYGNHKLLPDTAGVYMIYAWSKLVYVGRTWRFSNRLRYPPIYLYEKHGVTHIRLLECEDDLPIKPGGFIATLERQLIRDLKPPLNGGMRYNNG